MNEGGLQSKLGRAIKNRRGPNGEVVWQTTTATGGMKGGKRGVPDKLFCYRGLFVAIELKSPDLRRAKPTEIQAEQIRQIRAAGGVALCSNDFDECMRVFDLIDRELEGFVPGRVETLDAYRSAG